MIVGTLENCERYYGMGERIEKAFKWLKNNDVTKMEPGRHAIEGDKIFMNLQRYTTRSSSSESCYFEGHIKYIDIHCMIKGNEFFYYTPLSRAGEPETEYDPVDDDFLYTKDFETTVLLRDGDFAMVFPEDVHVAQSKAVLPAECMKAVLKVALED